MKTKITLLFFLSIITYYVQAQNIGINTPTPTNTLSVNGTVDIAQKLGVGTATPAGALQVKSFDGSASIIDQQQIIGNGSSGTFTQWQSFTAGVTGLLTRIDLSVGSPTANSSEPGTIKIYAGEGNTGPLLSTVSVTFQSPISFKSFNLSTFVPLTLGNKYTIEFSTPNNTASWVETNNNNLYTGGLTSFANLNVNLDFLFKTYVSTVLGEDLFVNMGKVGIGTTNPTAKLDIAGNVKITDGSQGAGKVLTSDANGLASWATPTGGGLSAGTAAGNTPYWNGTAWVTNSSNIYNNGVNVGIGNTNPQAPLHVSGNAITTTSLARAYFNVGSGSNIIQNTAASGFIQVQADGYFWANNGGFVATSDARIKNIIGITDNKKDLDILKKIEITDYTYKDNIHNNAGLQKKVIAQQLKSVYPMAVSLHMDVIPNVFEIAKNVKSTGNTSTIETKAAHEFTTGDMVKLILESGKEIVLKVTVINAHSFAIEQVVSGKVFVYGKKVNDLHTVDYDALTTLNISATQELLKRIELLEKENLVQKTDFLNKLTALEAKINTKIEAKEFSKIVNN
jgi:Chaperone of endosialidase